MIQKISDLRNSTERFKDEKKANATLAYLKAHKNITTGKLKEIFEINDVLALLDKLVCQGFIEEDPTHKRSYKLKSN